MTTPCVAPDPGPSRQAFSAMWQRQQAAWHVLYAVIWAAALAVMLIDEPGSRGRWPEIAALVGMAVAYAALGVPGLAHHSVWRGVAYQLVSWGLLLLVGWLNPGTEIWILFFVLFPHLWAMLPPRVAAVGTVLAVLGFSLLRWSQRAFDTEHLGGILVSAVTSIGLSLALGLFINRIITEAETRADTIDELHRTRAELAAVERDRGVHEERERLSREIHDTLAQGFTSVLALTRAAQAALLRGDLAAAEERLGLVERTAVDNLREARVIVAELTPGHLLSRTLGEALQRLGHAVHTESGINVEVRLVGEPVALGGTAEVALLRAAQEGLANVRRHSGARSAVLTLDYTAETRVRLDIEDDGRGFDTTTARAGFGLDGLRSRASELGGTLDLRTSPGAGTVLLLTVPR